MVRAGARRASEGLEHDSIATGNSCRVGGDRNEATINLRLKTPHADFQNSIQTWALEEARRRLEAEGILPDPDNKKE